MNHPLSRPALLLSSIWLAYVALVIYGSLVPLDFRPQPLAQAWSAFENIPFYQLGVESRADWIANGILYIPVGFLSACLLVGNHDSGSTGNSGWPARMIVAALFSLGLAWSVEFAQIFFPPRTVSLNDLLAESVGSIVGLLLATRYFGWFEKLLQSVFASSVKFRGLLPLRLLEAYLIGYIAFSLFPFDLLLSAAEFESKLQSGNWGWWIAGDAPGRFRTGLKLILEIILTLPFGLFLGYCAGYRSRLWLDLPGPAKISGAVLAAMFGFLLGGFIEAAQFLTATGVSQGASILTRMAGVYGGLLLWEQRAAFNPETLASFVRRYSLPLTGVYLLLLLQANGGLTARWHSMDHAASQLGELHFLPFYYHYFTTEARALFSLASVFLMYLPLGLLTWSYRGSPLQAFCLALGTALLVETGKLFLQGVHADPTNILIAGVAGGATVHLANALAETAAMSGPSLASTIHPATRRATVDTTPVREKLPPPPPAGASLERGVTSFAGGGWMGYTVLLPASGFVAYRAATFPTQPLLLSLFLVACAAVLWQRPQWLTALLLAALPVLDLAPFSGRFYLDEFDLLVMLALAIGYWRLPGVPGVSGTSRVHAKVHADPLLAAVGSLLAISLIVGAWRGLLPWQTPDANAFTNYYSPFNALRIAKGALEGFLIWGLLRRMAAAGMNTGPLLTVGMVTGLALTVAVILGERLMFSSLLDFSGDYRVTGPFSAMHTGGAYIECYLAIATPFLLLLIVQTRRLALQIGGALLLLATTYALMITFSRNGYAAYAVALAIILFFAIFRTGSLARHSGGLLLLAAAMLAVALPVFTGQFAQERLASVGKDYETRQAHWQDALAMRTPDLATGVFGMGLGRYPESHYLLSNEGSHAGTYQLKVEDENGVIRQFLRLGPGDPVYIEQIVAVAPRQNPVLKLDLRTSRANGNVSVSLCEKWMLTSYRCVKKRIATSDVENVWQPVELVMPSGSVGNSRKPVKFALHTPTGNFRVDVDNIRLENDRGEPLLQNGDFSDDLDHWFFSADNHLQWHAKSLPVALLFDLGWFGLVAVGVFSLFALKRAAAAAWHGDLEAAAALAAFSGFLVVGLFDTLLDTPRFLLLFVLLGLYCGSRSESGSVGVTKNA